MFLRRCFLILVIAALVGSTVEGKDKTLYVDKKAKVPVKRIALLYVHYPREVVESIGWEQSRGGEFAAVEKKLRASVTQRLKSLGYKTDDATGGNWYLSSASYGDQSRGGMMGGGIMGGGIM